MQESANFPAYLWQIVGKPVSVLLNVDIVDRLAAVVEAGYRTNSWRGLEVGGLLLGRSRSAHGQTVVEVADFEPIESEHAAGLLAAALRSGPEGSGAAPGPAADPASLVGFTAATRAGNSASRSRM